MMPSMDGLRRRAIRLATVTVVVGLAPPVPALAGLLDAAAADATPSVGPSTTIELESLLRARDLRPRPYGAGGNVLPSDGGSSWWMIDPPAPYTGLFGAVGSNPGTPTATLVAGIDVLQDAGIVGDASGYAVAGALSVQPVPLPAAGWLLASAFAVLAPLVRRRC